MTSTVTTMDHINAAVDDLNTLGAIISNNGSSIKIDPERVHKLGYVIICESDELRFVTVDDFNRYMYNSVIHFGTDIPLAAFESMKLIQIKNAPFSPT